MTTKPRYKVSFDIEGQAGCTMLLGSKTLDEAIAFAKEKLIDGCIEVTIEVANINDLVSEYHNGSTMEKIEERLK